jgi:mRNA interferase MazF
MPHPTSPPRRGEIYWVDFNPSRGSEQAGRRPAVVISQDSFNSRMPTVVVAAITSQLKPAAYVVVNLPENRPLRLASQILAFQVTTIDKSRLESYAGELDTVQLGQLKNALRMAWDL